MALETDRREPHAGPWGLMRSLVSKGAELRARATPRRLLGGVLLARRSLVQALARIPYAEAVAGALGRLWSRLNESGPFRFVSATLARRIFVSNLLGLLVLLGGMIWLSQHQAWLITAKRESLRVQGEIIAAAIAASATIDTDRLIFDPERLPEVEGARLPYRDDAFAAVELSLRPDRVGPVLRRLIQASHNTRARIYGRDGDLIVDHGRVGAKVSPAATDPSTPTAERVRVRTFWTKFTARFDGSDLPVYREIGSANGTSYPEVRLALKGTAPPPMLLLTDEGKQIVSLAVPIQRRNSTVGALLLSTRPGEIDEILAAERWIIFSLAVMAMLATLMASMMLARTIAGPVRRLSAAAEHVSQSINARADLPDYSGRRDEVGMMADAFKRMTASLYRRIEASEKFAADVAHELKNPLTAARATAESMSYAKTPEQREVLIEQIRGELKRLNRLITDVSNASRLDAELARQKTAPVDVSQVLSGLVDVFKDVNSGGGVAIGLEIDRGTGTDQLVVRGHEGRIGQVATNLLDNAISFAKPGDRVTVSACRVGAEVEIAVVDQGPGMPDDKLEAVFERFYSDRPESDRTRGKNSGLGLSITREIVNAHGGRIWAENRRPVGADPASPPTGARFVVRLPAELAGSTRGQIGLGWR